MKITPFMLNMIDFKEASLLECPDVVDNAITLKYTGLTFLNSKFYDNENHIDNKHKFFKEYKDNMYLTGTCTFTFKDIISHKFEYYQRGRLLKSEENTVGDTLKTSHGMYYLPDIYLYIVNYYSEFYMRITIKSTNLLEINYSEDDLINADLYAQNPNKYAMNPIRNKFII